MKPLTDDPSPSTWRPRNNDAARTATHLLESIEANTRRTLIATVATTLLMLVTAGLAVYLGMEYWRIKTSMATLRDEVAKSMPSGPAEYFRPARGPGRG